MAGAPIGPLRRTVAPDGIEEMAEAFLGPGTGLVITDAELRVVAVNVAYAEATGQTTSEVLGSTLDGDAAACAVIAVPCEQEATLRDGTGRSRPMWMRVDVLRDPADAVRRFVFTFTDISVLKREQDQLRHQAQHDALTGLPNRVLLADELQRGMARAQRHARPMALMFIDIDHFKRVNDALGHAVGDALLRDFAQRLRHALRAEDVVARLGGDEFVALIEDLRSDDDAVVIAQGIMAGLTRPFEVGGRVLHVSASIGIARFPHDAGDAAGLTGAADAAMYLAKQNGRARFQFCGDGAGARR